MRRQASTRAVALASLLMLLVAAPKLIVAQGTTTTTPATTTTTPATTTTTPATTTTASPNAGGIANCQTSAPVTTTSATGTTTTVQACTLCSAGWFVVSGACKQCSNTCTTCNGVSGACSACVSNAYLTNGQCIACSNGCSTCTATGCSVCLSGFYMSGIQCAACSSNCLTCSSATSCSNYNNGYSVQNGYCTASPSSGSVNPLLYVLGGVILLAIIGGVLLCVSHRDTDGPSYGANTSYGNNYAQTPSGQQYGYVNQTPAPNQGFFAPQPQPYNPALQGQAGFRPQGGYVQMGQYGR